MKKKSKLSNLSITILGTQFNIDKNKFHYHIFLLVLFSLLCKIITVIFTIFFMRTSVDYFDLRTYALKGLLMINGQIPYIDFYHEYPILSSFLYLLASIPVLLFNNILLFFPSFQFIMILFDVATVLCVYLIALKIYNERNAFIAGIVYSLSLLAAYTTLTRFDSFAVFLTTLSVLFILYNNPNRYITSIFGFLTKVFPLITIPFGIFYSGKKTSYKEEIKVAVISSLLPLALLVGVFCFVIDWKEVIKPYIFATGSGLSTEYANTFTFAVYSWVHDVFRLPVDFSSVSNIMYCIMISSIVLLLFVAYKVKEIKPIQLIIYICLSLSALIIFTKFHSPQYFMWVMPFLAILVADKIEKVVLFFIFNIINYIEFPLMFGTFYTNVMYINSIGSHWWYITLFFFSIEYIVFIIILKMCSFNLISDDIKETIKYYIKPIYNKVS